MMPFGMLTWKHALDGGPDPPCKGQFWGGMTSGFSSTPLSTVPSGPDIGILLHAILIGRPQNQSNITLNFSNEKSPAMQPVVRMLWPLDVDSWHRTYLDVKCFQCVISHLRVVCRQWDVLRWRGGRVIQHGSTTTGPGVVLLLQTACVVWSVCLLGWRHWPVVRRWLLPAWVIHVWPRTVQVRSSDIALSRSFLCRCHQVLVSMGWLEASEARMRPVVSEAWRTWNNLQYAWKRKLVKNKAFKLCITDSLILSK